MVKIPLKVKTGTTEAELYPYALAALSECLEQIPSATVVIEEQPGEIGVRWRPDFRVHLTHTGHRTTLVAEFKRSGEPLYAQNVIRQLQGYRHSLNLPEVAGVFVAPYISEEAAKLCREEGIGYLDLAGNCHLAFDSVYIHVEGKPNPAAHSRPLRSLYQPKAERVLRVLLTKPSHPWRIQALADEAGVSIGQSFKVKNSLREKQWLEETDRGFVLTKPRELLAAWAEQYRFGKHQAAQFYTLSALDSFEQTLSFGCQQREILCGFTSFAAASRYAPYANSRRTTAYIHREQPKVQELLSQSALQLDPVETGANVILVTPYDDGVFYDARERLDITLVSPLQTYLDLQSSDGRGREAAEFLFQKEILPNW